MKMLQLLGKKKRKEITKLILGLDEKKLKEDEKSQNLMKTDTFEDTFYQRVGR